VAIVSRVNRAWLPFGLFEVQLSQIWPFYKLFARNEMVLPFDHILAFLNVDENGTFYSLF